MVRRFKTAILLHGELPNRNLIRLRGFAGKPHTNCIINDRDASRLVSERK